MLGRLFPQDPQIRDERRRTAYARDHRPGAPPLERRRIGDVRLGDIDDLHWARTSGGTGHRSPFVMIYGYLLCDRLVAGTLAHSCVHGDGPHRIKIVVVKKDNPKGIIAALMTPLGPQIPRATLRLAAAGTVLPPLPKRRRARASATGPG